MLLSIITINYNNATGLKKTIESVLTQTSHDFEYIIIDGASTDGSVEYLKTINNKLQMEYFDIPCSGTADGVFRHSVQRDYKMISEPDTGIYNAMNKGIKMAKGDYIHFLNSGDWLVDEHVVEKMLKIVNNSELRVGSQDTASFSPPSGELEGALSIDILVGNVLQIRSDGKVRKTYKPNQAVSLLTFYRGTIQHTSAYIRRELFDKYGLYDENLKIVADWKWYMQVAGLNNANVVFTDIYVSYFDMSGISSTKSELDKAERRKVLEDIIPASILADYDRYHFDIDQMERIKKHKWLYRMFWFIERVYFKMDKVKRKKFS